MAGYLGQLPQSDTDFRLFFGISIIVVWLFIVYFVKKGSQEDQPTGINIYKKPKTVSVKGSNGYIYDVNNNKILTMDMNPINEDSDIFVPRYTGEETVDGEDDIVDAYTPEPEDYEMESDNNNSSSSNSNGENYNGVIGHQSDAVTDVNAVVKMIVKGDRQGVFDYFQKMNNQGVPVESFAESIILELDEAYQSKIAGDTNARNIALSEMIAPWSNEKIEIVIATLFTLLEKNYSDPTLGMKVTLLRMMKS